MQYDGAANPARKSDFRSMKHYELQLDISADEYLAWYAGSARYVLARSTGGQTIRFPASLLQRFVTPSGVHGTFVLSCDDAHKGARLQRKA